jgi:hypothetical protein
MRKRSRKTLIRHNVMIAFLFVGPFAPFLIYLQGGVAILGDCALYNQTIGLNTSEFIPPNFKTMAEWADILDKRFEDMHMPSNIALRCTFTNYTYSKIDYYHSTDNVGLSTGLALATYCFKYKACKDIGDADGMAQALRIIKGLVDGFSMLLAVPSGGIGPDYPQHPTRFVWSPEDAEIEGFEHITNWINNKKGYYNVRHYNGSGIYINHRWRGWTSKDECGGWFFGLGRALQLVDDPWVQERVKLLTAQMIEGFRKTNWMITSGEGFPVGTDLKASLLSGEWILSLLSMGKLAYPERYGELYHHYLTKEMYGNMAIGNSWTNTIMDYYAQSFGHKNVFNLITLTEDPNFRKYLVNQYVRGMYDNIKYHRVPYFNMMYLVLTGDDNETIKDDIFDQLMRFQYFNIETNGAIRNLNATPRPSWHQKNPKIEYWREALVSNPLFAIYQPLTIEFGVLDNNSRPFYLQPLRIENWLNDIGNFYGSNPFEERRSTTGNGLSEGCGNVFTVVYWMGRAYGIIPPPTS